MKYLQSIPEATYLTAGNAQQYRRIMRIFYNEYEKMHFQLYKEDVLEILKTYPEYDEHTMEQLKNDLNALTLRNEKRAGYQELLIDKMLMDIQEKLEKGHN